MRKRSGLKNCSSMKEIMEELSKIVEESNKKEFNRSIFNPIVSQDSES
jgi:hypothetical protein